MDQYTKIKMFGLQKCHQKKMNIQRCLPNVSNKHNLLKLKNKFKQLKILKLIEVVLVVLINMKILSLLVLIRKMKWNLIGRHSIKHFKIKLNKMY